MGKIISQLWGYTKRDKQIEDCTYWDQNEYSCVSGTTGSLIERLQNIHQIKLPQKKQLQSDNNKIMFFY